MAACACFTAWAILTEPQTRRLDAGFNFPLNPVLIGLCSHLVLFATGWLASRLFGGHRPDDVTMLTVWGLKAAPNHGAPEPAPLRS